MSILLPVQTAQKAKRSAHPQTASPVGKEGGSPFKVKNLKSKIVFSGEVLARFFYSVAM